MFTFLLLNFFSMGVRGPLGEFALGGRVRVPCLYPLSYVLAGCQADESDNRIHETGCDQPNGNNAKTGHSGCSGCQEGDKEGAPKHAKTDDQHPLAGILHGTTRVLAGRMDQVFGYLGVHTVSLQIGSDISLASTGLQLASGSGHDLGHGQV